MVHWLPEDLWRRVRPTVALQDDVNGFPRAGAMELLDRGIHRLFTGINEDSGGAPFKRPSAFWWKMPDGRRLFVYLGFAYSAGHSFFDPVEWRRGPVPQAGDTRYRPPRAGDFLGSDEASVRKAHGHLLERIRDLEAHGYRYPVLLLSTTNQWRIDNDPPFPPLAEFVAAWNRLEAGADAAADNRRGGNEAIGRRDWRPDSRVSRGVDRLVGQRRGLGPAGSGGQPSGQAAAAGRRFAALGTVDATAAGGSSTNRCGNFASSTSIPGAAATASPCPIVSTRKAQFNRKASLAFRPMAYAEWLLGQRVRSRLADGRGRFVRGQQFPAGVERLGADAQAARCETSIRSLEDPKTGDKTKLYFENGYRPFTPPRNPSEVSRENTSATFRRQLPSGRTVKFWVEGMPGQSIRKLRLSTKEAAEDSPPPARAADGDSGSARLAHRDHLAGHDEAAVPAREWATSSPCG